MNTLPTEWRTARFDEFLQRVERKFIIDDTVSYNRVGVRWYGKGAFIRDCAPGLKVARKQQWIIKAGDVVYNKLFAWRGSFAIADDPVDDCIVSDKFPTYRADQTQIDLCFLGYYFQTPQLARQAKDLSKGAAAISKLTLNPPQFWDLTIPLPPLAEQWRIVARIEELAAKVEAARALRQQAVEQVRLLIDSALSEILASKVDSPEWEFGPIPLYAEVNPSRKGKTDFPPGTLVSFVPMRAVDDATGRITAAETRPFAEVSKGYTWFQDGDVIFARITPCMQNGKAALSEDLVNGVGFGSTEFHVLRPGPRIMGQWLHALVRHRDFREDAASHFKGTAGQQRVPQKFLEQKIISVPPLPAQCRIVAYLDDLQARVGAVKQHQAATAAALDALLPSILDQAFKGEL